MKMFFSYLIHLMVFPFAGASIVLMFKINPAYDFIIPIINGEDNIPYVHAISIIGGIIEYGYNKFILDNSEENQINTNNDCKKT